MLHGLCPREFRPAVYALDLEALWARGIRGLVLDLDNTLVRWNALRPSRRLVQWLRRVQERGFRVCIVSNNSRRRVQVFARAAGVAAVARARKPWRRSFRKALAVLGTGLSETAVVGDQLFTDVWGGNRLGLYTILVLPVAPREFIGTRAVRVVERRILQRLERRHGLRLEEGTFPSAAET